MGGETGDPSRFRHLTGDLRLSEIRTRGDEEAEKTWRMEDGRGRRRWIGPRYLRLRDDITCRAGRVAIKLESGSSVFFGFVHKDGPLTWPRS